MINLRGSVVPVIDLGALWRQTDRSIAPTCIVIVEVSDGEMRHDIGNHGRCRLRGASISRRRNRAAAVIRRQNPRRLHLRHGQGKRQVRHPLNIDKVLSVEEIAMPNGRAPINHRTADEHGNYESATAQHYPAIASTNKKRNDDHEIRHFPNRIARKLNTVPCSSPPCSA